ncbi:hypothetical protein PCNPT3_07785 [Psychromonas sp. CNPT3]|uniref:Ig-like domain-containing protein n=1 Tax=Psychromonas sp. CNPT3 TaxID=314282 RepID=UPI0002C0F52E|nr:Ig-like domain-containing protein [Psychromonas sp. CNPT3]AGH81495.1 hypothetical protein PCNPT3_07785 [Psychromonas sp. CNPT3]
MADIYNNNKFFSSISDVNNSDAMRVLQNNIHNRSTIDFEIDEIQASIIKQGALIDDIETQSGTSHIGGHTANIDFLRDGNETLAHSMFNTLGLDPLFTDNTMSVSDLFVSSGSIEQVEISSISEDFAIEQAVHLSEISGNADSIDEVNESHEHTISNKIPSDNTLDNDETHVSISIDPITADNIISAVETKTDILITGAIGGDAQEGDSVILSVHSKIFNGIAQLENGALVYNIWVPGQDLVADNGTKIEAYISILDASNMAVSASAQTDYQVAPIAVDDPLGGLKGEYWGYVQNSWHKDGQGNDLNTESDSEKSYFFDQSYYSLSATDKEAKLAEFEDHQIQYGRQENLTSIAQVQDYISGHDVEINFVSTAIDYQKSPYSSSNLADQINAEGIPSNLAYFLNNDAVSITGTSTELATDGIMRLSGSLSLQHSGVYKFEISHDDGYQIKIDGISVSEFGANSSVIISGNAIALEAGGHSVEILYWDQGYGHMFDLTLKEQHSDGSQGENIWNVENLSHSETNIALISKDSEPLYIDFASNDTDIDGTIMAESVRIVDTPEHGSIEMNADGSVHLNAQGELNYTAHENYNGSDTFSYTIKDNDGIESNIATININAINISTEPLLDNSLLFDNALTESRLIDLSEVSDVMMANIGPALGYQVNISDVLQIDSEHLLDKYLSATPMIDVGNQADLLINNISDSIQLSDLDGIVFNSLLSQESTSALMISDAMPVVELSPELASLEDRFEHF